MTTNSTIPWAYIGHGHGLADIVGYEVRQTVALGEVLDVHRIHGRADYGDALVWAQNIRRIPGSYAVVDLVYADGCTSRDGFQTPIRVADLQHDERVGHAVWTERTTDTARLCMACGVEFAGDGSLCSECTSDVGAVACCDLCGRSDDHRHDWDEGERRCSECGETFNLEGADETHSAVIGGPLCPSCEAAELRELTA